MTNTRIRTDALGNRIERIATETHVFYDPAHPGTAQIVFQGEEYLTDATGNAIVAKIDGRQSLRIELADIAANTYDAGTDPVTGANLSQISPAGIAQILRAVYDAEHNLAHAAGVADPEGAA